MNFARDIYLKKNVQEGGKKTCLCWLTRSGLRWIYLFSFEVCVHISISQVRDHTHALWWDLCLHNLYTTNWTVQLKLGCEANYTLRNKNKGRWNSNLEHHPCDLGSPLLVTNWRSSLWCIPAVLGQSWTSGKNFHWCVLFFLCPCPPSGGEGKFSH